MRRSGWLLGLALVLSGGLATYLMVSGAVVPIAPNAVEVAVGNPSPDRPEVRVVIRQHCRGPVMLMSWVLEEKREEQWKQVTGTNFPGGYLLDKVRGFSFSVMPPTGPAANRLRVHYGLGLCGVPLWRERARQAWRTGRLAAAFRYNEWEGCETIAAFIQ